MLFFFRKSMTKWNKFTVQVFSPFQSLSPSWAAVWVAAAHLIPHLCSLQQHGPPLVLCGALTWVYGSPCWEQKKTFYVYNIVRGSLNVCVSTGKRVGSP